LTNYLKNYPITNINEWKLYRATKHDINNIFEYDDMRRYQFFYQYYSQTNKYYHVYCKNHLIEGISCDTTYIY